MIRFPQIGHNRLPRRQPVQTVSRDGKLFRADVFAEGKERAMTAEIIDCRSCSLVDLDLLNAGIALHVKDAIAFRQIFIEFLGAANIQDRVGIRIQLTDFLY